MKRQTNNETIKKMAMEIRESKLSGIYFFQRWLPIPQRMQWKQAFRNLADHEKVTLLENVARLRFTCQSRSQYGQIFGCCYYLERIRLIQKSVRYLRERNIQLTQQLIEKDCIIGQRQATKRIRELGLDKSFEEFRQIRKRMEQSKLKQKDQSFSEQKTSKSIQNFNKTSQSFFARLKALFTRQKSGSKQSVPEPTMEYIQLDNNEKEQS